MAVIGSVLALAMGRAMDAATLGDDEARSVGLSRGVLRIWMFLLAGALTAGAVALCGPIGFVGLIAPHAARLLLGPHHTPLVPAAHALQLQPLGWDFSPLSLGRRLIEFPRFQQWR